MKKIIIIGTLHGGLTPKRDIEKLLDKFEPDKVLVEIVQVDIKKRKFHSYPPEMIIAYKWAIRNKVKAAGFDSKIDVMKDGVTEKDNKKLMIEQIKLMKGLTWKDMNKEKNLKILYTAAFKKLVDRKKYDERDREMLKNIKRLSLKSGTTLVLTGCGHIDFFRKKLKNEIFPFM